MRFDASLYVILVASASCLDHSTPAPTSLLQTDSAAILTGATAYELEAGSGGYAATIGFVFTNPRQAAVYVVNCGGVAPPDLEKLVNGEWVRAWSAVVPLCLSPPLVIGAGQEYQGELHLFAGYPGGNTYPKFETSQISGVYRLLWDNVLSSYNSRDYPFGPQLPLEQRVSNSFTLKTP